MGENIILALVETAISRQMEVMSGGLRRDSALFCETQYVTKPGGFLRRKTCLIVIESAFV